MPVHREAHTSHTSYYAGLVRLALVKTEAEYGPCELDVAEHGVPAARMYRNLAAGLDADILAMTTSPERTLDYHSIPIPLLKGLMGYRVFFIRTSDLASFATVETLEDLKAFKAGQGTDWPDVVPLKHNGFAVVTAHNYVSHFDMLRANRFDFFPRGAQEILGEQAKFGGNGLAIEPRLVLAYPSPAYFHVRKDNRALAERIEAGLDLALKDGSFDEYFYSSPLIKDIYQKLGLDERKILFICNPDHNDRELLNDTWLWIKPWPENLCSDSPGY